MYYVLRIDISGGLVKDKDTVAPENGSRKAHQLPLTKGEVATAFGYFEVQRRHSWFQVSLKNKSVL